MAHFKTEMHHWLQARQESGGSFTPVDPDPTTTPVDPDTSTTSFVTPSVLPSSTTAPVTPSTTPATSSTRPTTSSEATSSSAVVPSTSSRSTPSSSIVSSTSTSVSVVVVTSVETVSGSTRTLTSASSSTALIPTSAAQNNSGGGGLSGGAKSAVIGVSAGVGGLLVLGLVFFALTRYMRKRRSSYEPNEDEIRWPEVEQDSGALFAPAVRRTGGAGLGRDNSMRSTTSGIPASITTAGYKAESSAGDHNMAGYGAGAYYPTQQPIPEDQRYSAYSQSAYGGYDQHAGYEQQGAYDPDPRDAQDYQYAESVRPERGPLRTTNYPGLDRYD